MAFTVASYGVPFVVRPAFLVQDGLEDILRNRMGPLLSLQNLIKRLGREDSGQDMIEYALLAAAMVVIIAGFLPPSLMPSVSTIFSKITSSFAIS